MKLHKQAAGPGADYWNVEKVGGRGQSRKRRWPYRTAAWFLIVGACVGVITGCTLTGYGHVLATMRDVSPGQGVPSAAAFVRGHSPHPVALVVEFEIYDSGNQSQSWAEDLPDEWRPDDVETTELVCRIGPELQEEIESVSGYLVSGGVTGSVSRVQCTREVVLLEARTGLVVAAKTLRGGLPREAQQQEHFEVEVGAFFASKEIVGSSVPLSDIMQWLRPFVEDNGSGGGFDRDKVQPAWKAYVAVVSARQVGVTHEYYNDLVGDMATQLDLLYAQTLSNKEWQFMTGLQGALEAYQRALDAWVWDESSTVTVDDPAVLEAWADADATAEGAVAMIMMVDGGSIADQTEAKARQDAYAKSLLRRAMTAIELAYVDRRTFDPAALTIPALDTMAFNPALLTPEVLGSIEPSITFVGGPGGGASWAPTALATDDAVDYTYMDYQYEVGTVSESGTTFGVIVDKSTNGGNTFYMGGEVAYW